MKNVDKWVYLGYSDLVAKPMKKLPYVRRQAILDHLKEVDFVDICSLQKQFDVSYMTIHRDIDVLEMQGNVSRVYGGVALQNKPIRDLTVEERFKENAENKLAIARKAAEFVKPGDVIGLDASTTALHMCDFLLNMEITVITNSIHAALRLSNSQTVNTLLYGGVLRKPALTLVGPMIHEFEQYFNLTRCFISAKSLCTACGLSDITLEESDVKKSLIRRSNQVFVLMDHTKIGTTSVYTVCDIEDIDSIITDSRFSHTPEQIEALERCGVSIFFAGE